MVEGKGRFIEILLKCLKSNIRSSWDGIYIYTPINQKVLASLAHGVTQKCEKQIRKIVKAVMFCQKVIDDEDIEIIPKNIASELNLQEIELFLEIYAYLAFYRGMYNDETFYNLEPKKAVLAAVNVLDLFISDELLEIVCDDNFERITKPIICAFIADKSKGNSEFGEIMLKGIELLEKSYN